MAGDWIKMNKSLPRDPRVVRISSALKADRLRTIGGLLSAWCLFDEQTEDGTLEGYTPEILDEIIGMPGLSDAMAAVGWLVICENSIAAPRFDEHNGQSAKRRAQDSFRKTSARKADKCPQSKRTNCGPEKRREEKSTTPPNPQGGMEDVDSETDTTPKPKTILPAGWEKMNPTTRKQTRVNLNSPTMNRIGKMLGRRGGTLWTVAEAVALKTVNPNADEIELMETYYLVEIPKGEDYRRRDLITLLNNWNGELDRARTNQLQ